jgi:hypothetical protein
MGIERLADRGSSRGLRRCSTIEVLTTIERAVLE